MALITMQQLPGNISKACLLAMLGGALSLILGLSVLFGWVTHNASLIQISAVFVPMQFNTALGFLLSGLGLLLVTKEYRRAGIACGIFLLLLGLLTIGEYIFGIDLGIDQLLMRHYITVATSHPGRMAPNTALCFLLTGAALIAFGTTVKKGLFDLFVPVLGSLVIGLGFIALIGYAVGIESTYGWGPLTRMAIHTASGFMVVGVGVISLAWHRDVAGLPGTPLWLPIPMGITVLTITISLWLAIESQEAQMLQQYGGIGVLPFVNSVLLVVGIVFAFALSMAVFFAQAARDRERNVAEINVSLLDEISERNRAEKKLCSVRRQLQASIEQMPIAYILWDDKFRVAEWNQAAEQIFGYSRNEMMGQNPLELIVPESARPAVRQVIGKLLAGKNVSYSEDGNNIRKDGTVISCKWYSVALQDETGVTTSVLSMAIDFTARKRAMEEREQLLRDKNERVKEITCLYAAAESIQGRTTLEEVFQDVAEFIPSGWCYPDIARGKIIVDGKTYVSELFEETEWKQSSDIMVDGKLRGSVAVYYLEARPQLDEGPFMKEERALINRLSGSIGRAIEYRQGELQLKKISRLYATLSQVNQAIVRAQDKHELFQDVCNVAVEFGRFRLVWIGLFDEEKQSIKQVAASGEGSDRIQHIAISFDSDTTRFLLEGESVVFNDPGSCSDSLPWCAEVFESTCLASAAFPLRLQDSTIGILNVCAAESYQFDEDETGLLEEMAVDISFALEKFAHGANRRQSEQALRRSEVLLSGSQEISRTGSWESHLTTRSTIWSDEMYRIYGLQPQEYEVTAETFLDFIHPDDREAVDEVMIESRSAERNASESEHRIIRRDNGEIRVVHVKWEREKDASGKILRSVGMVQDVTERRQAEEALLNKEREQNEILNSMMDAVITIDDEGNILSFNKMAKTLFGYSCEEVIGSNISRLMPEPYASKHDGYLQHYLETDDAQVIGIGREVEGKCKNKQTFPMRLSVAELPVDATGKRRFIGTCQDLTQVKKQEEQLRRTQKMDALDNLTGGIAHAFNNMLSVVTGYAEMLEDGLAEQPVLAEYAHEIRHAGERGARLTGKLLSFSRQEATQAVNLDIHKLLQQQQDMLEKTLTVRVKLLIDCADDVWTVWLDHSDLEDAIVNMCINAMHAMEDMESNARLIIRACNRSIDAPGAVLLGLDPGDYVQLSLTDNGVGMNETVKEQIFDPFFSTKREKGTGLGLSQVFGFVKRAGGAIRVASKPGEGSNFSLYFPRYLGDFSEVPAETGEDTVDLRGKENILVVDDEVALLDLTSKILSQQGYRIFLAENGKQALQILEHEHIDLMLSDVVMPDMNGYRLASIVKEKYPAIKIQLVSGFAETRNPGMIDVSLQKHSLGKPYNLQVMLKRIRVLLDS